MSAKDSATPSDQSASLHANEFQDTIRAGQVVTGVVTNIAPFGAFVQLPGNLDGLIHISQISDDFVDDISQHLTVGKQVQVRILSINSTNGRISLSLKRARKPTGSGYERAVQLGGDWGHPWGDDPETRFMDLGPRPPRGPYPWEPDPSLFEPWEESKPR